MDGVAIDSVGYQNDIRARLTTGKLRIDDIVVFEIVGLKLKDEYAYLAEWDDVELSKGAYISLLEIYAEEIYWERVSLSNNYERVLINAIEKGACFYLFPPQTDCG